MAIEMTNLRVFEVFEACTDDDLRLISILMTLRQEPAGTVICRQGEPGTSCYLLVKGAVVVYKELPARGKIEFASMLPGALFGQVSLLDGRPRLASCEARGPVQLLELTDAAFDALRTRRPALALLLHRELARALVRQLRTANQRLGELEDLPEGDHTGRLMDLLGGMGGG